MIVYILRMYKSKHHHTWNERLPYVQHIYNKSLHNCIILSPFDLHMGFQPLAPIDVALPIAYTKEESFHAQTEPNMESKLLEQIQHIQKLFLDLL